MNHLETLYKSLQLRKRPEDIAELVQAVLNHRLSPAENAILNKAAKGSLNNAIYRYTSMLQSFGKVVGAEKQIQTVRTVFGLTENFRFDYNNVPELREFVAQIALLINKTVGANDFRSDRLNSAERKMQGITISRRKYNKQWRILKRLEKKILKIEREYRKLEFQKISKHGIVHWLSADAFMQDPDTACFIAYYNARCNLRSVFTNGSQERPFDEISQMLFDRCVRNEAKRSIPGRQAPTPNWLAIAYIYPAQRVLEHLSGEEKGELLGVWTNVLEDIADLLAEIWNENDFNGETMIVKRGDDSSTWNNTAGAWNKARDAWMNLIYSLGMEYVLDDVCFGQAMRLMAGDVVFWHMTSGSALDPNTAVWNELPWPWEVFRGYTTCTRKRVEAACKAAGIDAEKSGWIAPRKHGVAKFMPTPELVHGVAVHNAFLAKYLRSEKFFSGKKKSIS